MAHIDIAPVVVQVVEAIGDRLAEGVECKVMIIDGFRPIRSISMPAGTSIMSTPKVDMATTRPTRLNEIWNDLA